MLEPSFDLLSKSFLSARPRRFDAHFGGSYGLFRPTRFSKRWSKVCIRLGEIGLDPHGFLIMFDCVGNAINLLQNNRQTGVRYRGIRVHDQGFFEMLNCLVTETSV